MKTTNIKPKRQAQPSQCSLILQRLRRARGGWVTMPALVKASGSFNVHSRVDELRNRGYAIENETNNSVRPHISRYRLPADVNN